MRTLDITDRLDDQKPLLKFHGKEYEVDNSAVTMNQVMYKLTKVKNDDDEISLFNDIFAKTLGEKAVEDIKEMKLSYMGYRKVFFAVLALATEQEYEVVEESFRKQLNK